MVAAVNAREGVLIPLRVSPGGKVSVVTQVRSTLIASSFLVLRARGHERAYLRHLPPALHDVVLQSVAGSWMPLDVGMAHYAAANAIGLSMEEQLDIGSDVAVRIQNSLLGTLVRVAKGAGVTPWTGLEHFQRLWDRLLDGGAGAVYRLGPKEARVEMHGVPLVEIPYFRNAWRGMFLGSASLFCAKMYVTEIPRFGSKTSWALRLSWA
jgi:hypothetical protein